MFRRSLIEQIIYIYYVKISEQKGTAQHEFVSKAALPLKFLAIIKKYDIIRYKSQNPTDDRCLNCYCCTEL